MRARLFPRLASSLLPPLLSGCVMVVTKVDVTPVHPTSDSVTIGEPIKVHLRDGGIVVYRDGLTMVRDSILGSGMSYGLTLRDSAAIEAVPLDGVAGMERFDTSVESGSTAGASLGVTTIFVILAAAFATWLAPIIDGGG